MSSIDKVQWNRNFLNDIDRNNNENIIKMKNLLNETGSGFCLAKFTQATLHLRTGLVHFCHHPTPHKISATDVVENPALLFNTPELQKARSEMKNNEKPKECDYCWRVEDNQGLSDRFYKSIDTWAINEHDRILASSPTDIFYPSYLEVDFSNVCNFKCIYCGPEYSTQWADELRRKGPLKTLEKTDHESWVQGYQPNLEKMVYRHNEYNPYLEAFWKLFPELITKLRVYRITGGEPLLSNETYKSMQWFIDNPNTDVEFSINSNLGVPDELWDKFIIKATEIAKSRCVKKFTVFTSIDAWGEKAEYLRPGLNTELFKKRYIQLLEIGNIRVVTMCAFNILSVTSILELLQWHLELKKKYNPCKYAASLEKETGYSLADIGKSYTERSMLNPDHYAVVGIDTPYIRHPDILDAQYTPEPLVQKYLIPAMQFMSQNQSSLTWLSLQGFEVHEIEKMKRVCLQIMQRASTNSIIRAKFFDYINEIDTRNNTDFLETFPEFRDYFMQCKYDRGNIITHE